MHRRSLLFAFPLSCLLVAAMAAQSGQAGGAASAQAGAPTVDELIARNLQAKGGAERLAAVRTIKQSAVMTSAGMEANIRIFAKRPNLMRQELEGGGMTMVMAFDASRKSVKSTTMPIPPLARLIKVYEEMASLLCPSRIVALTPNTSMLSAAEADDLVTRTEAELGLPTADVIRHGTDRIVEAILERHEELKAADANR